MLVVATGVGKLVGRGAVEMAAGSVSREVSASDLESKLLSKPELRMAWISFKANYPVEYQAYLADQAASFNKGGLAAANQSAFESMRRLMSSKAAMIAAAPAADLGLIADEYAGLMTDLQRYDVELCAQFGMTGFTSEVVSSAFSSGTSVAHFSTSNRGGAESGNSASYAKGRFD